MKSLKESIIRSNNAGIFKITPQMIADKYTTTTLNDVFDMKKMYNDAEKISGVKPDTHADAFIEILCSPDIIFHQSDIKELTNPSWRGDRNGLIDKILKEKFKKYINPGVQFNFFWQESIYKKPGMWGLGVLVRTQKGSYNTKHILEIQVK